MKSAAPGAVRPIVQLGYAALLALAAVAAFGGAVSNGWILLDDPEYVLANPHVLAGWTHASLLWCLTGAHGGNWHPLTSLSHVLDVALFGTDPAGPHAVNVALHALGSVCAFVALARLTGRPGASCAAALLVAVHPLRVESVAWISERKDVLSGVLFWLALLAYARWVERPGARRAAPLVVLVALGLLAKPMLVTLPFVLLLLDVWPRARLGPASPVGWALWPRVREKLPLFALAAASSVITLLVQRASGAMRTAESIPFGQRLLNAPVAVLRYLRATLWPADLSPYYPFELWRSPLVPLASLLVLAALTFLAVRALRARPWLAVGWLWFLGMLVPVLGFVQVGGQALADRYTYLPSAGLAILLVFGAQAAIARRPAWRAPAVALLALVALASILASRAQTARWRDTRTLAEHALAAAPGGNALAHQMLANALLEAGDLPGAREHLAEALRLTPDLHQARNTLGVVLAREGRWAEAEAEFRALCAAQPTPERWHNLGLVLGNLQRFDEAAAAFAHALRLDPGHRPSLLRHATALLDAGHAREAGAELEALLARTPDDPELLLRVAHLRATHPDEGVRDAAQAVRCAERARALLPADSVPLLLTLAAAWAEAGRLQEAAAAAERALALARAGGDAATIARCEAQLAEHRAGRPWRDAAPR